MIQKEIIFKNIKQDGGGEGNNDAEKEDKIIHIISKNIVIEK